MSPQPSQVVVARRGVVAEDVVELRLERPDRRALPAWEPGAHIDVTTPAGPRQFSLTGDPNDRDAWTIGVLREPDGRGGSSWMHDRACGDIVDVCGPRNAFALEPAPAYVFVAGGIGITPIRPMLRTAASAGARWRLAYGGRTRRSMAFLDDLASLGERVGICPRDESGDLDLDAILGDVDPDALVYCCGPEPLLDAVQRRCEGELTGRLRIERFRPQSTAEAEPDEPFEVELTDSGTTLTVAPGQSILRACMDAGVEIFSSCEEGMCGTCETDVLAGAVDHRDSILTDEERAANATIMICVSRAAEPGGKLVLDL